MDLLGERKTLAEACAKRTFGHIADPSFRRVNALRGDERESELCFPVVEWTHLHHHALKSASSVQENTRAGAMTSPCTGLCSSRTCLRLGIFLLRHQATLLQAALSRNTLRVDATVLVASVGESTRGSPSVRNVRSVGERAPATVSCPTPRRRRRTFRLRLRLYLAILIEIGRRGAIQLNTRMARKLTQDHVDISTDDDGHMQQEEGGASNTSSRKGHNVTNIEEEVMRCSRRTQKNKCK